MSSSSESIQASCGWHALACHPASETAFNDLVRAEQIIAAGFALATEAPDANQLSDLTERQQNAVLASGAAILQLAALRISMEAASFCSQSCPRTDVVYKINHVLEAEHYLGA